LYAKSQKALTDALATVGDANGEPARRAASATTLFAPSEPTISDIVFQLGQRK
jgi:hypothetical protein